MEDLRYINKQLSRKIDAKDPFMTHGHQIIKPRSDDKKSVPEWVLDDKKVREIILRSFPKFSTDARQRKGAARWIRVIHLYFRMGMTRGQVAAELSVSPIVIKGIVQGLLQVGRGETVHHKNGHKRPRGRPKKIAFLSEPILAEDAKPNLFSPRPFMSNRTRCKSKGYSGGRLQVRFRRSRS